MQELYLWPENVPSWNLFQTCNTQWHVGFGGAVGLNYAGVQAAMNIIGIKPKKRASLFADFQVLERATLQAWQELREEQE